MMYKALSLFSGCGGLDLGMERSGFQPIAFVDFDPTCRKTLALNYPSVPCFDNVFSPELFQFALKSRPHVIYGGPPCQSFSTMGHRRYFKDERGKALLQYVNLVNIIRPQAFLMENVQGLAIANDGALLRRLERMFSIAGFKVTWKVVNAASFGVPQNRKRLIMFGSRKSPIAIQEPTLTRPVVLRDAISDLENNGGERVNYPEYIVNIMPLIPEGGNWRNLHPSLRKQAMGNADPKSGGLAGYCRKLSYDKPSPTLLTSPIQRATLLGHPRLNRPLSVSEYQRIQCFPDSWKLAGTIQDKYRQLGNAVPVTLGYELGKLLKHGL